ncbi:MAG: Hpt domain-containing protein [Leptospiraceae bacterium]|nr:Hpt domain-containing protein [Leptospiraceae bacterium]
MAEATPILDSETIEKLRSLNQPGKKDLVEELAELFFKDSPALIERTQSEIQQQSFEEVYKAVHRLKGSALYLGGSELGGLCQKMMAAAKEEDLGSLQSLGPELQAAYQRLKTALEGQIGHS